MEKQGVGRRKRPQWTRLLKKVTVTFFSHLLKMVTVTFLAVFAIAGLWADEEETVEYEPIEVRLETNPANPTVNNPWSVFILVNHPRPDEVSVDSPDFPSSLALERIRTDTRTILGANSQSERWTRVEFLFIPRRAEALRLEPFEVRIQERLALTDVISVRVQGESSNRYEPRFRWLSPPVGLRLGETGEITLELTNWDPARRIPEDFFSGRAPLNAILEENPPVRTDAGYRYTILLIPLGGANVKLDAFAFLSDTYTLSVPEISLRVLPAPQTAATVAAFPIDENPPDDGLNPDNITMEFVAALPFPQEREEVFFPWNGEYRKIIAAVEALWEQNRRADALAEIRKGERDSPVGPSLVALRAEMEEALGLSATENERWRPFGISLFSFVLVCVVLIFAGAFLAALRLHRREKNRFHDDGDKTVTSKRRYGFILVMVCAIFLGLVFILPEGNLGIFPASSSVRSGRIAVLRTTQSYRVPDYKGAVNGWFSEGQAVTVGDFRGEWCFAETLDGRSGWVERASVISY